MPESSETITRYGKMTANEGKGPELAQLLVKAAEQNKGASGCLQYEINQLADDADVIWVTEKWTDRKSMDASLADDEAKALIAEVKPLISDMEMIELKPLGGIGAGPAEPVPGYTLISFDDIKDSAPGFGLEDVHEARFGTKALDLKQSGFAHMRVKPGVRQPFGHRHDRPEEVYVVLSGSGKARLDDETVELEKDNVLRVSPQITRAFEAGPDGLEYIVFSQHFEKDGALDKGFWPNVNGQKSDPSAGQSS